MLLLILLVFIIFLCCLLVLVNLLRVQHVLLSLLVSWMDIHPLLLFLRLCLPSVLVLLLHSLPTTTCAVAGGCKVLPLGSSGFHMAPMDLTWLLRALTPPLVLGQLVQGGAIFRLNPMSCGGSPMVIPGTRPCSSISCCAQIGWDHSELYPSAGRRGMESWRSTAAADEDKLSAAG